MSRYGTPLRYPGGKQRLAPFLVEVLRENDLLGGHYVEPYAGGAGIGIELLLGGHVTHVHLNDSCVGVHSFWHSVLTRTAELCERIASASLTVEEWHRQRAVLANPGDNDKLDVGFSFFYLNRCNRSGIVSGGVIGGLEQTGRWKIDARFPRNELIRRIEAIATRKKAITLRNWDAEKFIVRHIPRVPRNALVYCDPPYFKKGDRLYLNQYRAEDHQRVARIIQGEIKHRWLVSYDSCEEVLALYKRRRFFLYDLQYNAAKAYKGREAFFLSDNTVVPSRSVVAYIDAALVQLAA